MATATRTTRRRFGVRQRPLKAKREATVSELKSAHVERLRSYSDTYLMCRDLRHPWEPSGALWKEGGEIHRRLVCNRCGTERIDCWTRWGERKTPRYIYPDDYRMQGDVYAAKEIRVEVMKRLSIFDSEETMMESVFAPKRSRANGTRRMA